MNIFVITENVNCVFSGSEREVRDIGRPVAVVVTVNLRLRWSFDRETYHVTTDL